jgi:hypothetical protein
MFLIFVGVWLTTRKQKTWCYFSKFTCPVYTFLSSLLLTLNEILQT